MKRRLLLLAVALAVLASGCASESDDFASSPSTHEETEIESGDLDEGEELYKGTCSGCHGSDAQGIEGIGKSLVNTAFINDRNINELVTFIKVGRSASDAENTTGIGMPSSGGNPSLDDEDLADIVAYLKSLG